MNGRGVRRADPDTCTLAPCRPLRTMNAAAAGMIGP
jgi:hypothetical protein